MRLKSFEPIKVPSSLARHEISGQQTMGWRLDLYKQVNQLKIHSLNHSKEISETNALMSMGFIRWIMPEL